MTDRRILEALRRILVTPAAPPERSVQRLRLLVTTTAGRPQPALGWRAAWHRRMAAPVIALGALLGMSSVAFALSATTPLGGVVRNVAHDVGLPVDSGRLVDIRDNLTRLRTALSAGDTKQARREATALKKRLAGLHPDEQGQLPEAGGLLEQALP
ncbi:MAG: hypothetical protein QOG64_1829, partial [Acidimicrobiaceae bacterium]|nr:hypothetical protein [Acidimicrobiaceae bacterium]